MENEGINVIKVPVTWQKMQIELALRSQRGRLSGCIKSYKIIGFEQKGKREHENQRMGMVTHTLITTYGTDSYIALGVKLTLINVKNYLLTL